MRRTYLIPTFIICLILSSALLIFYRTKNIDILHFIFLPFQKVFIVKRNNTFSEIERLKIQNSQLTAQLSSLQILQKENQALRDQFNQNQDINSNQKLLPAQVISMPEFFPGSNLPLTGLLDKGKKQGIYLGQPVVIANILIGTVVKTTDNFSQVKFVYSPDVSIPVRTLATSAVGILKGDNNQMVLENVVLSDILKAGDSVVTIGNVDINGQGILPNLVLGKILSIEKNPSALFQKASIKSIIDITKISTVFLIVKN